MLKTTVLAAAVLLVVPAAVYPEYVALDTLLSELGATLEWNPARELGVIVAGGDCVVFKIGAPWILFNYREKVATEALVRREGAVLFPSATAARIAALVGKQDDRDWAPTVSVILIDPGHGGRDSGTIGFHRLDGKEHRLVEKDIVLEVGLSLRDMLAKRYPDKKILLTRSKDTYPTLEERVDMAHGVYLEEDQAIIFLSLHANASFNPDAKGYEVWYLPSDYRRLVENGESLAVETPEIIPILNSIREEDITIESIVLAQSVLGGLDQLVGELTENRGLKEEAWFVVRKAKMPSVLIEIGFVTNAAEAVMLADSEYLMKITQGIYNGVCSFLTQFESAQ